jgi:phosphatidylglycerophosphate synthase
MSSTFAYRSDDRSLLLPYYKRWLVDPTLPFIPARVHPNVITHAGHVICLLAAMVIVGRPEGGWRFLAMSALLQVYIWCDNADGAHARRTKQSSEFGEFLDHGLDLLNTFYISIMSACLFDASAAWTTVMVTTIPAAASITAWEQAETGIYQLGLLNQIESCAVISATAVATAILGVSFWRAHGLGPLSADLFFMGWPTVTISFGYAHALYRVARARGNLAPALVFLAFQASIIAAAALGYASMLAACAFSTAANLYFGVYMLVLRLQGERPPTPKLLGVGLVFSLSFLAYRSGGHDLPPEAGRTLVVAFGAVFAIAAVRETRRGIRILSRHEATALR